MFVVATPEQSEALLEELADIEKEMFTELGLHFKVLVRPFSLAQFEATLFVSADQDPECEVFMWGHFSCKVLKCMMHSIPWIP